jgi:transposase
MEKRHIQLASSDRIELEGLLSKSSLTVKMHRRIAVLVELDKGKSYTSVSQSTGLTYPSIRKICAKYHQRVPGSSALEYLADKPRSGRPIEISGEERAKITALACSEAPSGHSRWTLRLLADKAVELGISPSLSHTYAGKILKKTNFNPI